MALQGTLVVFITLLASLSLSAYAHAADTVAPAVRLTSPDANSSSADDTPLFAGTPATRRATA